MGDENPLANEPTKNATESWSWGTTESYKSLPRALLFVVVRSKDSNTKLRAMLRRTWLSVDVMGLGDKLAYRFFVDRAGCCQDEMAAEKDLVVLDKSWVHPRCVCACEWVVHPAVPHR